LTELAAAGIYCLDNRSSPCPLVWVIGVNENLKEKAAKLRQWLGILTSPTPPVRFYIPPFEDPYVNNESDPRAVGNKVRLLSGIQNTEAVPPIIITTLPALSLKLEPRHKIPAFFQQLNVDGEADRDRLIERLTAMGYHPRGIVEEQGDIAWRGSIVDVFPIDGENPARIEIEGDTVVSIRLFDPDTQKSLKRISSIVFSISRFFLDYRQCRDYFNDSPGDMLYLTSLLGHYRMVVSDEKKVTGEFQKLLDHYEKIYDMMAENNPESTGAAESPQVPAKPPGQLFTFPFEQENFISIDETWDDFSTTLSGLNPQKSIHDFNLDDIHKIRDKVENEGYRLVIFSDKEDPSHLAREFTSFRQVASSIPYSFENPETRTLFLAEKPFNYIEKPKKSAEIKSDQLLNEIRIDDLVVHQTHGIGRFTGFKKLTFENHVSEFLKIEYLGKEYLYVPVYELDVLSKYVSFEGHSPKIDKMGGNSWALKNKRAQKSIITFARELLELYAMRKAIKGTAYTADYELEAKLGEGFEYVETEDQKRAIKDVSADLEAEFPMDRLICGDVSFGKTEVALRAAMRVVVNGNQVALLCPTTILAFQHYSTFKKRFADFPVSVAMLSRMVKPKRKRDIYEQLAGGAIDIIIGTHSLLSKDIVFKRLGLYIIDEEQRFGVFQKEKLKKDREDIDVLSMSATPIPRTLSLSLAGLQDISTIHTPPIGRLAVKNFVGYFSREIVVSAILNEMERRGQVFVVYNDIDRIYTFQKELQRWLPTVSTAVIHAKMKNQDIETNLMKFIAKEYQVLLSTTIIENGIDIPDVNTLIILNANRFGLTQLYQLRGRIGRGNRQAYSYFLVKTMNITDKAKSRLDAIREFADLGSGYKLAEFDLKLRGAGSLLGNRQHGHIEALGFDYYHQLLVKTINELKGQDEKKKEGKINIHFSYSIESVYIKNSVERISLYRRILEAENFERIEELRAEMTDRYGRPHPSVEKIFFAGMIRVMVKTYQLEEVDVYLDKVTIKFPDTPDNRRKLTLKKYLPDTLHMEPLGTGDFTWTFHFPDYKTFPPDFTKYWQPTPPAA
jgi:transcription-repair coupling factor